MNASFSQVSHLRTLLEARFPRAIPANFTQRNKPFVAEVSLIRGTLVEITSVRVSAGGSVFLWELLKGEKHTFALVDGADAFDPPAASREQKSRMLWVRCHKATEAIRAADLLLRDGNLPTVFLDLRMLPPKELLQLPSSVWHRLRMLAERSNTAMAVFSPCKLVSCASRRWILDARFGLEALEIRREELLTSLHPQLQRGLMTEQAETGSPALCH